MSLSVGAPLGDLGRGSVYRELREFADGGPWLWSISLYGSDVRGTLRGDPLLGALKVIKEGSGDGHLSSWGLSWANWIHLPGSLRYG
jgi:hypothetical protein